MLTFTSKSRNRPKLHEWPSQTLYGLWCWTKWRIIIGGSSKERRELQMNWLDKLKQAQQNTAPKQRPEKATCPDCGGEALIWSVVKPGRNQGRPRLYCQDKEGCKLQKWADLPRCEVCDLELEESQVRRKDSDNFGRWYHKCPDPNHFNNSFRWVKE